MSISVQSAVWFLFCALSAAAGEPAPCVADEIVFSDERAVLQAAVAGPWQWRHRVLTREGWQTLSDGTAPAATNASVPAGGIAGIHELTLSAPAVGELRFLAIDPPPPLTAAALARTLPRRGAALLAGEPFTLLVMGDSVTATGWYDRILARLLARATGNPRIRVVNRSYPGRSVDASVRHFAADTAIRPDLACIMYGLNDQGAWAPRDGYIEQQRWLVGQLRDRCHADVVLLQPTPDLSALQPGGSDPLHAALRTIGFAEALRPLAAELGVPLAETFAAIWQARGANLPAALASLRNAYPLAYDRQLTSLVEGDGRGDGIHPNALGHHALAQAVFAALAGSRREEPLAISAVSRWSAGGLATTLTLRNHGTQRLVGRLEVHPQSGANVTARDRLSYALQPGATQDIGIAWSEVRGVDDLFLHPYNRYVAAAAPQVAVLDYRDGLCQARAVEGAIMPGGGFMRGRQVCLEPRIAVRLATPAGEREVMAAWPADSLVGRQRLTAELVDGPWRAPVAAELAWVRMAAARSAEAVHDGELGEWTNTVWSPLGEPCQARWVTGPADNRASPDEFRPVWAMRAGRDAIHFALRVRGEPRGDRFTLFFDTRPAGELGRPGTYQWVSGKWDPAGGIVLQRGETSPPGPLDSGHGRAVDGGYTAEWSIPYTAIGAEGWPADGDLGFSLWWVHQGPGGTTHLQWSEEGHPWSTRGLGVARRDPTGILPWVVQVR